MDDGSQQIADPDRVAALIETGILDSEPEEAFDRLTRLAARLIGAPVSLASFVDADRQFFKSCFGTLAEPWHSARETPLTHSFCQHVVSTDEPLIIGDAREEPLVRDSLAIPDLGVIAYAGSPIRAPSGQVLGSFCVIDTAPREWTDDEVTILTDLAASVNTEIALRVELTELRRTGEALRQREGELAAARELAEAEARAKSNFLAYMSHEIRTPLSGVRGMVGLVLDDPLPREQRERIEVVRSAADALGVVVDDVLRQSRLDAGMVELDVAPFSIRQALRNIVSLQATTASAKGIDLRAEIDDAVPEYLVGDVGRIRQTVLNLVSNAIKFTDEGGVVIRVGAPESDTDSRVRIAVHDTGPGIAPDRLDAIFDPYIQEEASTENQFGGTGLGLAISKQLVELMGGRLQAESAPGEGTTFSFTLVLPEAGANRAEAAPAAPRRKTARPLRVLLAEDDFLSQVVATKLLEKLGHDVHVVGDGQAALDALAQGPYDIVLMDMRMPVLGGIEATRQLRAREGRAGRTPVVALTASATEKDIKRCRDAGMDAYLDKPLRREALSDVVERLGVGGTPAP